MAPLLHRIPRETKVAAVVLGAALVQVGVLAAIGLRGTAERRRTLEKELAERARPVVLAVASQAAQRVTDQEEDAERAMRAERPASPWERARDLAEREAVPLFRYAYLVLPDGRVADSRCAPPPQPPSVRDEAARARLADLLRIEVADPARAAAAAQALAHDLARRTPHDAVAAALALQCGWRAAYRTKDRDTAKRLASDLLARGYGALRDDRDGDAAGPLAEREPFGPGASAVLCDVLYESIVGAPDQASAFVAAVVGRRVQAQRLRTRMSDAAYRVEVEACERLRRDATLLPPALRDELQAGLERCAEIDRVQATLEALPRRVLAAAAAARERSRFDVGGSLLTVVPLSAERSAPGEPAAAAFLAPPAALLEHALEPAARTPALPEGLALAIRDAASHDLLEKADGPSLLGERVPLGSAVPGVFADLVLVDAAPLERETRSARTLWLFILAGAGLAVVAASLLAVRAVLREVRLARMKSDFVSNLSHELRTPLTSLRMFVETLREGRVRDEREAKECLDVVAQETDRLQSLLERMLQFASLARGRAPIELKSADAGAVARRAVALFVKRAEAARARLELDVREPLPEAMLDRDAVLQVLLNLLDNAVKHGRQDGAAIRVGVRAAGAAGGVVFEVEDDGPGVPEKERELVFEEFYRGDDTLSRRVEGTGLGLAMARRIALAHGGRIEATRSERLGGARFAVTLPDAAAGRRLAMGALREARA